MKLKPIEIYDDSGRLVCAELHCISPATWSGVCDRHDPDERPVKKRLFQKAIGAINRMERLYFKREERGTASVRLRERWQSASHRYADVALRAYHAGRL